MARYIVETQVTVFTYIEADNEELARSESNKLLATLRVVGDDMDHEIREVSDVTLIDSELDE